MNHGVEILLDRMGTHPEEFDGVTIGSEYALSNSRWSSVIGRYWAYLTDEEKAAINDKMVEVNREMLTAAVMNGLMNGGAEEANRLGSKIVGSQWQNQLMQLANKPIAVARSVAGTGVTAGYGVATNTATQNMGTWDEVEQERHQQFHQAMAAEFAKGRDKE